MARRSCYAAATAAVLALAACSERQPEGTTGPQFSTSTDPCGFSNSLVTGYFPSSNQSYMLSVKSSMANASTVAQKRIYGFQMMDSIGSVSRNTAVNTTSSFSAAAGAQLTVAIIGCIFPGVDFSYPKNPGTNLEDSIYAFTRALTNVTGGAYYVRGGGTNGVDNAGRRDTVLGRTNPPGTPDGNLSGIAPSSGTWTAMLSGNTSPGAEATQGVLFYGYPVTNPPLLYEWATVPSALTFSPEAVVAVCDVDPFADPTQMLSEDGVGVLAYVGTNICGKSSQPLTLIDPGWGPKALAARLGRVLASAFSATPLQATVVGKSGTGGTTSTVPKSEFGNTPVTSVTLSWVDRPLKRLKVGTQLDTVVVLATTSVNGVDQGLNGACLKLTGSNNNGQGTALANTNSNCDSPASNQVAVRTTFGPDKTAGYATFIYSVTKTGGLKEAVSLDAIIGRAQASANTLNATSNVIP